MQYADDENTHEITDSEEALLRELFEKMMYNEPFRWRRFDRVEDGGYKLRQVQSAWHCVRCGFLAGRLSTRKRPVLALIEGGK